jgi:PIN domain nuclease of toxin-antitoxin system
MAPMTQRGPLALLVDTCTLIGLGAGSDRLPGRVLDRLFAEEVLVSEISRIEIVIKETRHGSFGIDFDALIERAGFASAALPVGCHRALATLPVHHRDPFDRMLIAHALQEDCTLITCDDEIIKYDVQTFW